MSRVLVKLLITLLGDALHLPSQRGAKTWTAGSGGMGEPIRFPLNTIQKGCQNITNMLQFTNIHILMNIYLFPSTSFYFIWQVLTPQNARPAPHQCRSQSRRRCLRSTSASTISLVDLDISKHPSSNLSGWFCNFWVKYRSVKNMKSIMIFGLQIK